MHQRTRYFAMAAIFSLFSCALFSHNAQATPAPNKHPKGYNATLGGFAYPFKVKRFAFRSQGQALQMAYMHLKAKKNRPTFVLFHGKNFSGAYWEQTAKLLHKQGYGVLMPDQIGFGKSSKPAHYQYSFPQLAYNSKQLLDALKLKKVVIVGHSMGGMLAARFCLLYPHTATQLLLVNPIGLENYLQYVQYKDIQFFYKMEQKKTRKKIKQYQLKNYYDGKWKPSYNRWVDMLAGWTVGPDKDRVAWNNALTYDMIFSNPVITEFNNITQPTVLILGDRDRTGPGRHWKKPGVTYELGRYDLLGPKVVKMLKKGKLFTMKGLGHMPHIEAFPRFKKVLTSALTHLKLHKSSR